MESNPIRKVAVIGAGAMGAQIAMICALEGYPVFLNDLEEARLEQAREELEKRMKRWIEKKRLTGRQVEEAFERLEMGTSLASVSDADLVIEAVVEKLDVKRELFKQLDELTPPHTILATNSSTIVSSKIADATNRQEKVCNLHFFNPPLVMELVEVVQGSHTSEWTAQQAFRFVEGINKTPVLLKKEISGFIANRILGKLMDEAVFLLENGYATHEEIDTVCTKALNHPIGPFSLMDLTGLDVNYFVRMQRYKESGNEADRPAKIVEEKVNKGELGRKTGKGFYQYS
ncbi:3-hydroxybutyryl-CoA dehydrogenase [Halobacillus karajensis]|uniref:3-hydroxybutyryl-CoA dehydrogenase n=1 Tax=Halobacillus karajensis TaxID=195088 RepID=A0A024P3E3_9BACI|nr:3-hydroxyacyl-CoA dehydrogenase family protein [Halobacillus karajensis]CDQ19052.1 putative 3-hydroxybutyryl-CoA dehydrogenase [Halobacillus karajensis]CDQ22874.1 putative 3-hydroxybutyryl-CoA dehydrogenase [Halobacillus karajensis]CDQ26356.1 putative 3-hydroxybutyryl-CoA dehydrogenase [Halobacillus karajensis]SEH42348.1 3-hydroxybutyryl-CoA dehydrogenase [Halobacillus karajensis]